MYTLSEAVILYAGTQRGGECSPDTKLLGWIPLKYSVLQNFNKILNSNLNLQTSLKKSLITIITLPVPIPDEEKKLS